MISAAVLQLSYIFSFFHIANETESYTGIFSLWLWFSLNPSVSVSHPCVSISRMLCTLYMSSSAMHSIFLFFIPASVLPSSNDTILNVSTVICALRLLIVSEPNTDNKAEVSRCTLALWNLLEE